MYVCVYIDILLYIYIYVYIISIIYTLIYIYIYMPCLIILPLTTSQDDLQQHGSPRQWSLQRAIAGPGASLLRRQRLRRRGDLRGGELEVSLEPPGLLKGGTQQGGALGIDGYPMILLILRC